MPDEPLVPPEDKWTYEDLDENDPELQWPEHHHDDIGDPPDLPLIDD